MAPPSKSNLRFRVARVAIVGTLAIAVAGASASAASASWGWSPGGSVSVFAGPHPGLYYSELPNGLYVRMICWTDTDWYHLNYWSPRWFKVWTAYTDVTWMHSSQVYYQTWVPHC